MLRYSEKTERIEFILPAKDIAEVKALFTKYKDDLLEKIMIYAYNVYSYDSIFSEYTLEERKDRVCYDLFDNKIKSDLFELEPIIKAFLEKYKDMSLTSIQRDHERCKKDIEDLHLHISNIPFIKKEKIKRNVFLEIEELGKSIKKEIDMEIEIDNSEEKIKALGVREKLYSLDERLRKLVQVERLESEMTAKTMFEE